MQRDLDKDECKEMELWNHGGGFFQDATVCIVANDLRWLSAEQRLVETKRRASRLGFAVLLVFFRERGRFPRAAAEIDMQAIRALSEQFDLPLPIDGEAFLCGRKAERLRAEIRCRFCFREATVADADNLTSWRAIRPSALSVARLRH